MNRIICDICGLEYPENAERCPVCNYPRQGTEKVVAAGAAEATRTKVKGGQFSAKNVKKRRKEQQEAVAAAAVVVAQEKPERNPNKPLWITIIVLLIAIVLVSAYIIFRFFRGGILVPGGFPMASTSQPVETTVPTEAPTVPCAAISLETSVIAMDAAGQEHQIVLTLMPEQTTDAVVFASSDPAVVAVSETGVLTAVSPGQATITITCGNVTRECTVVCWFTEEPTVPSESTVPAEPSDPSGATEPSRATEPANTTEPTRATEPTQPAELTLDHDDVSFFTKNETLNLYVKLGEESVSRSKVTWSSSDTKVATVDNGKVTAVGKGTATITAEYNGKKATCVIRCRFEDSSQGGSSEGSSSQEDTSWKASATDVTLSIGESFRLRVTNSSGETADAIWTMSIDGVVSINGSTITGRAPGTVTLKTTVDGVTLSCIVRVK